LKKSASESNSKRLHEEGGGRKITLRKKSLVNDSFKFVSGGITRNESCIYLAKVPRSWMIHGLLIIPFLSERAVRGSFELEVYCSEHFTIKMLQDSYARSVAGEWVEGAAGGSHLCPTWKKNPKFNLKLRSLNDVPVKIHISVTRHGSQWERQCHRDTVGSMIGFYIFIIISTS